jgi:hypothetical protein
MIAKSEKRPLLVGVTSCSAGLADVRGSKPTSPATYLISRVQRILINPSPNLVLLHGGGKGSRRSSHFVLLVQLRSKLFHTGDSPAVAATFWSLWDGAITHLVQRVCQRHAIVGLRRCHHGLMWGPTNSLFLSDCQFCGVDEHLLPCLHSSNACLFSTCLEYKFLIHELGGSNLVRGAGTHCWEHCTNIRLYR